MLQGVANFFDFKGRGTKFSTELFAGITTFTAMSYIIFLQPSIMSGQLLGMDTGMDFHALIAATCIAAAFGSILMGLLANYPIGLAPGMGENFFFVLTVLPACALASGGKVGDAAVWQMALGIVFTAGILFAILTLFNIRKMLMNAISPSLKSAIAAGIGLFIAFIGLKNAGLVAIHDSTISLTDNLRSLPLLIFAIGLIVTSVLRVLKIRGAILWGIIVASISAVIFKQVEFTGLFALPPSPAPVFAKIDMVSMWDFPKMVIPLIVIFVFMDVFDTLGTLICVGSQAGLMKDGKLKNAGRAFASDAGGTLFGAVCGHSTVTSYIESATGVEFGGRTGLTAIVAGVCFLLALFVSPLVQTVASCPSITAPALVIVGVMMMSSVAKIEWDDFSEAIPAFLIIIGIPLTFSIGDGMILGFVIYPIIKLLSGKGREVGWLAYVLSIILVLYLLFVRI